MHLAAPRPSFRLLRAGQALSATRTHTKGRDLEVGWSNNEKYPLTPLNNNG